MVDGICAATNARAAIRFAVQAVRLFNPGRFKASLSKNSQKESRKSRKMISSPIAAMAETMSDVGNGGWGTEPSE